MSSGVDGRESVRGNRIERLLRFLLWLYPRDFRREYGEEWVSVARDRLDRIRTAGYRFPRIAFVGFLVRDMCGGLHLAYASAGPSRFWRSTRGTSTFSPNGGNGSFGKGHGLGISRFVESVFGDIGFALRALSRRPLFAAVTILTLGLGIGAATAMFSVVDGVLLKQLPYDEPSSLVAIWQTRPDLRDIAGDDGARWERYRFTYPQYRDLAEGSTLYDGLAAYKAGNAHVATLTGVGDPVELPAGAASVSLLPLLGVRPMLGRWFLPHEEASRTGNDGASVVVLSYELWRARFGGSPETVGSIVTLDDRPYSVVGIMPPGFHIQWLSASIAGESVPTRRDVWFSIGSPGWWGTEGAYSWEIIGRLGVGVTLAQARLETSSVLSAHPGVAADGDIRVIARAEEEIRGLTSPLVLLFGATALLLIIACGNLAMVSMAEVLGRRHEIATRFSLGAAAPRIVRLLMTESLVLAALGSAVGATLAFGGTGILVALAPPIPRLHEVGVDIRVLGFTALIGTCAAFLFGSLPSVMATGEAAGLSVRGVDRTSTGRRRFSGTVIGMEIALTAMLLVASGLLTRNLGRLLAIDPGFDASGLAAVEVRLPFARYATNESRASFFLDALDRLKEVPGIGTVTAVSRLPFPGHTSGWSMRIAGRDQRYMPLGYQVAPGYLETLGVPLLAGRSLTETDGLDGSWEVVINETMALQYWPNQSPLGAQFSWTWGRNSPTITVVGVVGDVKRQVLRAEAEPAFFIPFSRLPDRDICFVARTEMDPRDVIPLMREAVWSLDRQLVVKNATTVAALVAQSANKERYGTLLVNVFGVIATLLAAVGIFGVTARSVARRAREMGIRMALGARGSALVRSTVRRFLLTGLAGTAVGLVGALWVSRLLKRFLYGVEPSDPLTYGTVAALIVVVCLLASYTPARRITRVNPVEVLRAE